MFLLVTEKANTTQMLSTFSIIYLWKYKVESYNWAYSLIFNKVNVIINSSQNYIILTAINLNYNCGNICGINYIILLTKKTQSGVSLL